jgi:hypothetical protein
MPLVSGTAATGEGPTGVIKAGRGKGGAVATDS